jgi:single-strand DNA-binding protein
MQTLNSTTLIGHIGADPETKSVGGNQVTNFSLATEEFGKDEKGEKEKRTEWHQIELWGQENLVKYLKKGTALYVLGRNKTSHWEKEVGKEKVKMQRTVVVASQVGLLDSKADQ